MSPLKTLLATVALFGAISSLPASAQEATPWPELMMRAADADKDGMLTRKEFLEHMARVWDRKHAEMMKADGTMKAGMMNKAQFSQFARNMFDPGQIGGN